MNSQLFRGAMTALITPFDSSGQIQEKHLRDLIQTGMSNYLHMRCGGLEQRSKIM